jgi:Raf kinase inhibitor-like YbhB/YbcL family protein
MATGSPLRKAQASGVLGAGGDDMSPHLSWGGFPAGTQSFAVTMYDPTAPTGSGFWHWAVVDVPVSVNELPAGAGNPTGVGLPAGAWQLRTDAGLPQYVGAVGYPGQRSAYFTVVHAVDVPRLEIPRDATCARLGMELLSHTVGRAVLIPWFEAIPAHV